MSFTWLEPFLPWVWAMASMSILLFAATLLLIPWLIVRLPTAYFHAQSRRPLHRISPYPKLTFLLALLKNMLGVLLIAAGLAMLLLPGQGLLTILIGITFTNFPGKYRLEQSLARRRSILRAMNWIRSKAHRPPLIPPPDKDPD
jgi:hypothetical protein